MEHGHFSIMSCVRPHSGNVGSSQISLGTLGTFHEEAQMNPVILIGCFTPLVIIFIVMKLAVWIEAANDERNYVKAESKKPHGPYVADAYADVDEEEEEYGDRTDYR
jgi:hypothetical protein|tara:strand:- start:722 stop:1042 length:321 start_codon:yes stop_codon:yes gene_type:complete